MYILFGRPALFLACRPPFFIPFHIKIHPEFSTFYADLSGVPDKFILMKIPIRLDE